MKTKQVRVRERQWKELKSMSTKQGISIAEVLANLWQRMVDKDKIFSDIFTSRRPAENTEFKGDNPKNVESVNGNGVIF